MFPPAGAHGLQPGVVQVAIDEEIGAHGGADRKQRDQRGAVARELGVIGERRKIEGRRPTGLMSKPMLIEWQGSEFACKPERMRRPILSPFASTISRAEMLSPVDKVTLCRSSPVAIAVALAVKAVRWAEFGRERC